MTDNENRTLLAAIREVAAPRCDPLAEAINAARMRQIPWTSIAREVNAGSGGYTSAAALAARFGPRAAERRAAAKAKSRARRDVRPLPGISVAEAADLLGISPFTVRNRIAQLPSRSPAIVETVRGSNQIVTRILNLDALEATKSLT